MPKALLPLTSGQQAARAIAVLGDSATVSHTLVREHPMFAIEAVLIVTGSAIAPELPRPETAPAPVIHRQPQKENLRARRKKKAAAERRADRRRRTRREERPQSHAAHRRACHFSGRRR